MIRDKIKNRNYFSNFIQYERARINKFASLIDKVVLERGENDEGVKRTRYSIFNFYIHCFVAQYSAGINLNDLKNEFSGVVTKMEQVYLVKEDKDDFILDSYNDLLWICSLAIMLEVEQSDILKLVKIYEKHSQNDFLLDTIISYRINDYPVSEDILYPEEFEALANILKMSKPEAEARLKVFLDKEWYKKMKDTSWQGLHKEKEDLYFGYWSFESGAIVKVMGLDDSSFKDNQYYPYDMAHFKG